MLTQLATLQLHKTSIISTSFSRDFGFEGGDFDIKFELTHQFDGDTRCFAELTTSLTEQHSQSDTPCIIRITMVGEFEFVGEINDELRGIFMNVSMPSILYPYIRAFVSSLTVQAGMQAIILPLVNFANISVEQKIDKPIEI